MKTAAIITAIISLSAWLVVTGLWLFSAYIRRNHNDPEQ